MRRDEPQPARFTSVDAYRPTLAGLIGPDAAAAALDSWLSRRLADVADPGFAARFRAHFARFDAPALAYAPRVLRVGRCDLLARIRFYGGDGARPFVDLLAWSHDFDVAAACAAIRAEWRRFAPFAVRVLAGPAPPWPGAYADQTLHAARAAAMPAPVGACTLVAETDIDRALGLVRDRHAALGRSDPALAAELYPADHDTLAACRDRGTLHTIAVDGRIAGLIATLPGTIEFLPCHLVVEEIVSAPFSGRGLAAEAQRCLAARLRLTDPASVLAGTIQRSNRASAVSAVRAGRPVAFSYWFVAL
ncbi:MAG: hypothetical protein R3F55_16790 [Alphaproteobacteria bacterium]